MPGTVHIVGAGLAGLSAAVRLADRGAPVTVYEAAGHGGGRCRSYYDDKMNCRIDNGNHLLLSGNHATFDYLKQIGSERSLVGATHAEFPFLDVRTGESWSVKPDPGVIPWSLFSGSGRVPRTRLREYLRGLSLAFARPAATVSQCLAGPGELFEKFWEPLSVSVLNTEADQASARLLWPVLRETFGRGGGACIPLLVRDGLSESFVDPAIARLRQSNNSVLFNHRLRKINFSATDCVALDFAERTIDLPKDDRVILAVPANIAGSLVPGLTVPDEFRPIVNGHFRIPGGQTGVRFMGLVGGDAHWLFIRNDVASITVSAATQLANRSNEAIAARLWADICVALNLGEPAMAEHRIVKEKRATFAQTPAQVLKRPGPQTTFKNLYLAGDWTQNGLPATIEGTIRSGRLAADMVK